MEPSVGRISFSLSDVAEIEFSDGRQVVIRGSLAIALMTSVQDAVRSCFSEARRTHDPIAEEN